MRSTRRPRQALIALSAAVSSAAAAVIASYLLLVGPSPRGRQVIAATVPGVAGRDPVTVAALAPAAVVVAGVLLALLYETTRQAAAARDRRRALEGCTLEDLE